MFSNSAEPGVDPQPMACIVRDTRIAGNGERLKFGLNFPALRIRGERQHLLRTRSYNAGKIPFGQALV